MGQTGSVTKLPKRAIHSSSIAVLLAGLFWPLFGIAAGEELFVKNCAPCHGRDGKAHTPVARKLGVKDLSQSKLSEAEIEKQIVEGKRDDHGTQKMPSFKGTLSAEEIKSLVTWVKELRK